MRTVALLERLIAVPTHNPGGDEHRLAVLLAEELDAHKPNEVALVSVPRPSGEGDGAYVFARWGEPRLLVNAHLDTVPPNRGYTGDPFRARIAHGHVTGLGAADTKGAIAAALAALDEGPPKNLALLFSGDEELGGSCLRAFLASPHARGIERAVVCEPTGCQVGARHRGVMALEFLLQGAGGHSSRADHLPAPIAELARLAVALQDWGVAHRDLGPPGLTGMCLNVAKLEGGVAFNVVADRATLTVSLRPPPGSDAAALAGELIALAERITPRATTTVLLDNPPFGTRDLESFRPYLGARLDAPLDLAFWTEAAILAAAGIDAVVFGPGDIEAAHSADERVAAAQLEAARAAFAALFLATRAGRPERHGSR